MSHRSYLIAGATVAALGILGPAQAQQYSITTAVPALTSGASGFPWESTAGGVLDQLLDGSGNFVSSSHGLPIICESGCSGGTGGGGGTVTQGPQGTNTSPWFVSPGTSTFPVSGTVTSIPSGTSTIAGAVSQGAQGTNTSPWFVSPGTSTFPISITGTQTNVVSGTVTAIPGAGTSTVLNATGTNTIGTAGVYGTVTSIPSGTHTALIPGGANFTPANVSCGTAATVISAARATRQTITIVNISTATVYIGGTGVTTAAGFPLYPLLISTTAANGEAEITIPSGAAVDCIASAASSNIRYFENY